MFINWILLEKLDILGNCIKKFLIKWKNLIMYGNDDDIKNELMLYKHAIEEAIITWTLEFFIYLINFWKWPMSKKENPGIDNEFRFLRTLRFDVIFFIILTLPVILYLDMFWECLSDIKNAIGWYLMQIYTPMLLYIKEVVRFFLLIKPTLNLIITSQKFLVLPTAALALVFLFSLNSTNASNTTNLIFNKKKN